MEIPVVYSTSVFVYNPERDCDVYLLRTKAFSCVLQWAATLARNFFSGVYRDSKSDRNLDGCRERLLLRILEKIVSSAGCIECVCASSAQCRWRYERAWQITRYQLKLRRNVLTYSYVSRSPIRIYTVSKALREVKSFADNSDIVWLQFPVGHIDENSQVLKYVLSVVDILDLSPQVKSVYV